MNEFSVRVALMLVVNPPTFLPFAFVKGKEKSTLIDTGATANNVESFAVAPKLGRDFTGTELAVTSRNNGNKSEEADCGETSEDHLPDLVVIIKEGKHDITTLSPKSSEGKIYIDGEEAEHGMAIICTADYPIYLEFWVDDKYIGYFMRPDVKHCKCDPTNCFLFFRIGIWLSMDMLYSGEATKLTYICSSTSGKAQGLKKAVITRWDNKTHMEIQTIWKKKRHIECKSGCTPGMILSLLFDARTRSNVQCVASQLLIEIESKRLGNGDYNWEKDSSCGVDDEEQEYNLCVLQCWIAVQLYLLVVNETLFLILYVGIWCYGRTQIKPIRARLRREMLLIY